jgi:hypothetical protein
MQPTDQKYRNLLTEAIQKQIIILGPQFALMKARNIRGLSLNDDGTVSAISGNLQEIKQQLIDQFSQLSTPIGVKMSDSLIDNPSPDTNSLISLSSQTNQLDQAKSTDSPQQVSVSIPSTVLINEDKPELIANSSLLTHTAVPEINEPLQAPMPITAATKEELSHVVATGTNQLNNTNTDIKIQV